MNQSTTQGKSKKPYVPPKVKAHGKVYQLTQGGTKSGPGGDLGGYSLP
jgi:hypothetical protein